MHAHRTLLAIVSILIWTPFAHAQMLRMEHRFEGLVANAFMSDDGALLWTCEDGGRVRFRDSGGVWTYLDTPDLAQNTLRAIHFVPTPSTGWGTPGNLLGWTVGDDAYVFYTIDGGATWSQRTAPLDPVGTNGYGHMRDVHFVRVPTSVTSSGLLGFLVGLHGMWKSTDGSHFTSPVTLLDAAGNPINPLDIELYAVDILQCGEANQPTIVACGEPGLVFRNVPDSNPANWGAVMQVVWDIREQSEEDLSVCGDNALYQGIHKDPHHRVEIWDIEFQRKCTGSPLLVMVAGGEGLGGSAYSSTDYGSTFVKECHECEVSPSLCTGNTDYELTSSHDHYKRHHEFNHLYGVAVFGDGSAVAGGYGGQHVVRRTDGVWEDRSQQGFWALEVDDDASFMLLNCAVSQRNAGSTSSNGKAFMGGQGGQGRSTTAANATTSTPPNPPGQPGENWTRDWPTEKSGWWRMEATAFNLSEQGWRVGQNYHVARTTNGGLSWVLEDVLPYGYHFMFRSIAISPSTTPTAGTGVAVGQADPRELETFGYGSHKPFWGQPKILRRHALPGGVIEWIEPVSITWLSNGGALGKQLLDVTWAATVGPNNIYWTCGEGETLLRSTDNGATWLQYPYPSGSAVCQLNALAFKDQDTGILVGRNPSTGVACSYAVDASATPPTYDISPSGVVELFDVAFDAGTNTAYAVGSVNTGTPTAPVIRGQVFSSTLSGSVFSPFAPITGQPSTAVGVEPCNIGDFLGHPPLNSIAVATNGDLWVGGECGRVWRRVLSGTWEQVKSQTDGHILDLAPAPGGYVYATFMRLGLTGPGTVRWNPGSQ